MQGTCGHDDNLPFVCNMVFSKSLPHDEAPALESIEKDSNPDSSYWGLSDLGQVTEPLFLISLTYQKAVLIDYNNVLCFNEKTYVNCLKQCPKYRKYPMNSS